MKPRILIVADHAPQRGQLARWLMSAGYLVELAEGAKRAREVMANDDIALAIVAGRLGSADPGLVAELRSQVKQHILLEEPEDATGGEAGAPIEAPGSHPKPLTEQELLALVKAALPAESSSEMQAGPQLLRFEGYTLDIGSRTCLDAAGRELALTRAEFSLLLAFGRMPGRVLSRDELRRSVAGRGAEPDDRSIDMTISRLRRKIEPDPKAARIIITVPGNGYKFTPKPLADFSRAETSPAPSHGADAPPGPTETKAQESKVQQTTLHENSTGDIGAQVRPSRRAARQRRRAGGVGGLFRAAEFQGVGDLGRRMGSCLRCSGPGRRPARGARPLQSADQACRSLQNLRERSRSYLVERRPAPAPACRYSRRAA